MTLRMRHIMVFIVLTHTSFGAARLTGTLYALSNKASAFTVGVQIARLYSRWCRRCSPFKRGAGSTRPGPSARSCSAPR